jgi:AcrR family transcriptional regulator
VPRPREYDDDLRSRLLETAARLLADEGAHHVTTRRVAAEVGTSTTAIYSLIGSKEDLFRAIYREGFQRLADHLAAVARTDDPIADVRALGRAYHENAIENPELYKVMFECPVPEFALSDEDSAFGLSTLQVLIDAVQRCVDAGELVGAADELAIELWALNHGITSLAISGMLVLTDRAGTMLAHASAALLAGYRVVDAVDATGAVVTPSSTAR